MLKNAIERMVEDKERRGRRRQLSETISEDKKLKEISLGMGENIKLILTCI